MRSTLTNFSHLFKVSQSNINVLSTNAFVWNMNKREKFVKFQGCTHMVITCNLTHVVATSWINFFFGRPRSSWISASLLLPSAEWRKCDESVWQFVLTLQSCRWPFVVKRWHRWSPTAVCEWNMDCPSNRSTLRHYVARIVSNNDVASWMIDSPREETWLQYDRLARDLCFMFINPVGC